MSSRDFVNQLNGSGDPVPGTVDNDSYLGRGIKPRVYQVCPRTLAKILVEIAKFQNGMYNYQAGNVKGGYNCTGFACKALESCGVTPPYRSNTPYLSPDLLAN